MIGAAAKLLTCDRCQFSTSVLVEHDGDFKWPDGWGRFAVERVHPNGTAFSADRHGGHLCPNCLPHVAAYAEGTE